MSREYKFRAWDKEDKRMIVHEQDFIPLKVTNIGVLKLDPCIKENRWMLIESERFELMRYTGLKGKNGKDIYEGDIVRCKDFKENIGVVMFGNHKANDMTDSYKCGNLGFYIEFSDKFGLLRKDILFWDGLGMEVIGNIHENSDILSQ